MRARGCASALVVLASVGLAGPAHAADVPGALVFSSDRCDQGGRTHPGRPWGYRECRRSIFRVGTDGQHLRRLTNPGTDDPQDVIQDYTPAWSPDGKRIVFSRYDQRDNTDTAMMIMNADGSDPHPLSPELLAGFAPTWSPDGATIAYYNGEGIAVVGSDGSEPHVITPDDMDVSWPHFTPDGRDIIFSGAHDSQHLEPGETYSLWAIHPDGTNLRRLVFGDALIAGDSVGISPDWRYVAFSVPEEYTNNSAIYTMRLDGSELTRRTDVGEALRPVWAPFGPTLFFVGSNGSEANNRWGVRSVDLSEGGPSKQLTDAVAQDAHLDWSPRGAPLPDVAPDHEPPAAVVGQDLGVVGTSSGASTASTRVPSRLPFAAFDRSGIRKVRASVGLRSKHNRCRFLQKSHLTKRRSCSKPRYITVGSVKAWHKRTGHLPAGTYVVRFRTTDSRGNTTRHAKRHVVRLH